MSDIFQEVDEELRHDKWLQLWKQYQNYIIGVAVLIVVATAVVTYWKYYDQQQREAEGLRYALALDVALAWLSGQCFGEGDPSSFSFES
ncbi:MAG TPA: hypothetical protein VJN67_20270 [Stellaceae bacterium]|nr:hypothetical protein [Stellaceae bacterium]